MTVIDAITIAFRSIYANRLRSILTALGMIIGVASVIALIAIGQGTQQGVKQEIMGLGSNLMFVQPGSSTDQSSGAKGGRGSATTLVLSDVSAIMDADIEGVYGASGQFNFPAQAIGGGNNDRVEVTAVDAEYAYEDIKDEAHLNKLLDTEPMWDLFGHKEIVEQLFHIGNHFEIVKQHMPTTIEQLAMILK